MPRKRLTRKRIGWLLAAFLLIAAIALTYRLTRPPELVWWTSPPIANTGRRVTIMIPRGWALERPVPGPKSKMFQYEHAYTWTPRLRDDRPELIRRVLK